MPEIDNSTIIAIGALIVAAIAVILSIRKGKSPDEAITLALRALQSNDEAMRRYEGLHAESNATVRQGFATVAGFVRVLAPITPWEFDDTLADVLEDVQTPGKPNVPPTA